jgi:5-methylcytosine-specific restriction endonuclease McrA
MTRCHKCETRNPADQLFLDPLNPERWYCEKHMIVQVRRYVRRGRPIPGYWVRRFGIHISSVREEIRRKPCAYCGTKHGRMTIDHFMPKALGGSDKLDNLRPACIPCNQRKADMHPDDWMELLQKERRGLI